MNSGTVIFIHIPKAAGSTLNQVLNRQYKAQHILCIKEGMSKQDSIDSFKQLPKKKKAHLRCIRGHMPFGLHQWLPQPATYLTILRNPVERLISYYYFVLETPIHHFHSEVVQNDLTLEDFVTKIANINETNLQTRWISGCVDFDSVMPPYEDLPANALDLAKANIKSSFSVCGLTERFDESLLLMQRVLRWKSVVYIRRNIGKRQPSRAELPSSTLRLIEKCEEQDLVLYEFAAKRLTEMLDGHGIGNDEVWRFRAMNRLLGAPLCISEALTRKLTTKVHSVFCIPQ